MTKICFISDTHGLHRSMQYSVPKCDILAHTGDVSNVGEYSDVVRFLDWFIDQPAKHHVYIAGNHDWLFQIGKEKRQDAIDRYPLIHYLESSSVTLEGLKIYGDPHQPEFCNWAFNLPRGKKLKEKWDKIPEDTDVLLTHGPPMGILDEAPRGGRVGCVDLLDRVYQVNPKIHAFGHIHCEYGKEQKGSTLFVNSSICNESYQPINEPILVEVTK